MHLIGVDFWLYESMLMMCLTLECVYLKPLRRGEVRRSYKLCGRVFVAVKI